MNAVTNLGWCVSHHTSSDTDYAELSVFKAHTHDAHGNELRDKQGYRGRYQYGSANGMRFATTNDSHAYALARGYLQEYHSPLDFQYDHRLLVRKWRTQDGKQTTVNLHKEHRRIAMMHELKRRDN